MIQHIDKYCNLNNIQNYEVKKVNFVKRKSIEGHYYMKMVEVD